MAVFFLISGFLLYRPFAASHIAGGSPPRSASSGYVRFLRIMPAYWLVFVVTSYWMRVNTIRPGWHSLIAYLGLAQIYIPSQTLTGVTQAWSLCTEIAFYLFLPLYAMFIVARRRSDRHQLDLELAGVALLYIVGLGSVSFCSTCTPRSASVRGGVAPVVLRPLCARDVAGGDEQLARPPAVRAVVVVAPGHALGQLGVRARVLLGGRARRCFETPPWSTPRPSRGWPKRSCTDCSHSSSCYRPCSARSTGAVSGVLCGGGRSARSEWCPTASTCGTRRGCPCSCAGPNLLFKLAWWKMLLPVLALSIGTATISYFVVERPILSLKDRLAWWNAPAKPAVVPLPEHPAHPERTEINITVDDAAPGEMIGEGAEDPV